MNTGKFCRNCLSKWYAEIAEQHGMPMDYEQAREVVYGMPYASYKAKYQTKADPAQLAKLKQNTNLS